MISENNNNKEKYDNNNKYLRFTTVRISLEIMAWYQWDGARRLDNGPQQNLVNPALIVDDNLQTARQNKQYGNNKYGRMWQRKHVRQFKQKHDTQM